LKFNLRHCTEERNESYLLLADAGRNLHAMREAGGVAPRDVRRHARSVLQAEAYTRPPFSST